MEVASASSDPVDDGSTEWVAEGIEGTLMVLPDRPEWTTGCRVNLETSGKNTNDGLGRTQTVVS